MEKLKEFFSNQRNVVIVFIAVIVLSSLFMTWSRWVRSCKNEGFDPKEESVKKPAIPDKNDAFVDPQTGAVMDGPGFEKGPVEGITQDSLANIPSNYYFLDDGADGEMSIQHNLCSKSCCSEQWPTPFKQKYDPYVCGNKDQFVPSKIMCNNTFQDSGLTR